QRLIYGYRPGQTVTVGYARYGTQGTARITLMQAEEPKETVASADRGGSGTAPSGRLGIDARPLTPTLASEISAKGDVKGLVVRDVDPTGPAARLLFQNDVIMAVIGRGGVQRPVLTNDQLNDAIASATNGVVSLLVYNPQAGAGSRGTRVVNIPLQ